MKNWEKKAGKNIRWDIYWIVNHILSKEMLEKELIKLTAIKCDADSKRGQNRKRRIWIVEKELLKFN